MVKKNHNCDSCGKVSTSAGDLKKHINSVHNVRKDHKCDSCRKAFSEAGSLKKHINSVHHHIKNHECDSCGKSFSEAGNLKKHIELVHEGHKDYKCESCGKSEDSTEKLKKHIQDAGGEEVHPKCNCFQNSKVKPDSSPFYVHLGASKSLDELREILENRCFQGIVYKNPKKTLRVVEVKFLAIEAKTKQGCPLANEIIRRTSKEEKFVVISKIMISIFS